MHHTETLIASPIKDYQQALLHVKKKVLHPQRTQDPDPITPYTTKESPISLKPNSPKKRKKKKEHINGRKTALSETLLSSAQQQEE